MDDKQLTDGSRNGATIYQASKLLHGVSQELNMREPMTPQYMEEYPKYLDKENILESVIHRWSDPHSTVFGLNGYHPFQRVIQLPALQLNHPISFRKYYYGTAVNNEVIERKDYWFVSKSKKEMNELLKEVPNFNVVKSGKKKYDDKILLSYWENMHRGVAIASLAYLQSYARKQEIKEAKVSTIII